MGNNGGFNPYRDANGEFTDPGSSGKPGRSRAGGPLKWAAAAPASGGSPAKRSAGAATKGAVFNRYGKLQARTALGREAISPEVRKGPEGYRTRAAVLAARPAPAVAGAKVSAANRAGARQVINDYAFGGAKPISTKANNATLVRAARGVIAKHQPILSHEEQGQLEHVIGKLTTPRK